MHDHRRAKEQVRILEMVNELAESPQLTSTMFHELSKRLGGPGEQRSFSLRMMSASSPSALEFGNIIGETAKMINRPTLDELVMPKRP